jgi:hypothetical protein
MLFFDMHSFAAFLSNMAQQSWYVQFMHSLGIYW